MTLPNPDTHIKTIVDTFLNKHNTSILTNELRVELATVIEQQLKRLGYKERLVRVLEPESNGDSVIMVCTRNKKSESNFKITAITLRGELVPEELIND